MSLYNNKDIIKQTLFTTYKNNKCVYESMINYMYLFIDIYFTSKHL